MIVPPSCPIYVEENLKMIKELLQLKVFLYDFQLYSVMYVIFLYSIVISVVSVTLSMSS